MDPSSDTDRPLRFGLFVLDVRSRELRKGPGRVRLHNQTFEILRLLLERPGDVVTRDELQRRLWPDGTFVDFEHSINAAVKRLRAALGDDADNPRFVETVPRLGYRFISAVDPQVDHAAKPAAPPPAGRAPTATRVRLAVLPFSDLSSDRTQEYFSDGLTEEMIAQLGTWCRGHVGVIARWSSMVFKGSALGARDIGDALGADYLLEGSVRRDGDRIRIVARLVETRGETHLWSQTFERHFNDWLSVQTEVATRIASSLATELAPNEAATEGAVPPAPAYQAYLKGRYHWNRPGGRGMEQALVFYEDALAAAPDFGAAHAAMARAQIVRAEDYRERPRRLLELARAAAERALQLAPLHPDALLAIAEVRRMFDWDWHGAESVYLEAITLNPSSEAGHRMYGLLLAALERFPQAVEEAQLAHDLDPLCLVVGANAAWVHYLVGDFEGCIERACHLLDMDERSVVARRIRGAAYLQAGDVAEAWRDLEQALALDPSDPVTVAWLAHADGTAANRGRAHGLLDQLERLAPSQHVPAYHLALANTAGGNLDQAFAALETACADRDPELLHVGVEPRFAPLRGDVRYGALLNRLNLTNSGGVQLE